MAVEQRAGDAVGRVANMGHAGAAGWAQAPIDGMRKLKASVTITEAMRQRDPTGSRAARRTSRSVENRALYSGIFRSCRVCQSTSKFFESV
jgi:hypothetical protein